MRPLFLLAATLPFGGPSPTPSTVADRPPMTRMELPSGLVVHVGTLDKRVASDGLHLSGPIEAYHGTGTVQVRQGLWSRDVDVALRNVDARELLAAFGDIPAGIRGMVGGTVGQVTFTMRGDVFVIKASQFRLPGSPVQRVEVTGDRKARTFVVKAHALGGVLEYQGQLPGGQ